jgi:hypothetical protein
MRFLTWPRESLKDIVEVKTQSTVNIPARRWRSLDSVKAGPTEGRRCWSSDVVQGGVPWLCERKAEFERTNRWNLRWLCESGRVT